MLNLKLSLLSLFALTSTAFADIETVEITAHTSMTFRSSGGCFPDHFIDFNGQVLRHSPCGGSGLGYGGGGGGGGGGGSTVPTQRPAWFFDLSEIPDGANIISAFFEGERSSSATNTTQDNGSLALCATFGDIDTVVCGHLFQGGDYSQLVSWGGWGAFSQSIDPNLLSEALQHKQLSLMLGSSENNVFEIVNSGASMPRLVLKLDLSEACIYDSFCTAIPNSTGSAAGLYAMGQPSIEANNFGLVASNLPANQFGVMFYGQNQLNGGQGIPFGEGLRCVGGQSTRLGVQNSGSFGFIETSVDLSDPAYQGAIQIGNSLNFQLWYRDPSGGPEGWNLSNGLSVNFCQ